MTNPIHERIGGKYFHPSSTRYWFYSFIIIVLLSWIVASLDTSTTEPVFYSGLILMFASSAALGIVAMFAAPFASQVVSQMRRHEAYELIQITTLTRQHILHGLLSGMLTRFQREVGFALFGITIICLVGAVILQLASEILAIMLTPVLGVLGLCYLGLIGGIASGLLLKNTIGANVLALSTHFVVVAIWFLLTAYMVDVLSAYFNANDYYQREAQNLSRVALVMTIVPYLLTLFPLTICYFVVRRT